MRVRFDLVGLSIVSFKTGALELAEVEAMEPAEVKVIELTLVDTLVCFCFLEEAALEMSEVDTLVCFCFLEEAAFEMA